MYQDFQNHKKSDGIKWIAVLVSIILLAVMVSAAMTQGFTNGNPYGWFDKKPEKISAEQKSIPIESDPLVIKTNEKEILSEAEPGLFLTSGSAMAATASDGTPTVTKTITATVLPEDAPDKSVDWSIVWCTPLSDTAVVTDYLTVTPDSDGSLTATITAYQGFEGASAYVTATTRVGGFSATCLVTYEGAPESLGFIYNATSYDTTGKINLAAGAQYAVTMDPRNTLGAVGSKYGQYEIKSITGAGKFVLSKEKILNGTSQSTEDVIFDLGEGSYSYTDEITGSQATLTIPTSTFIKASIISDALYINAIKTEASYTSIRPRTGYFFKYKGVYTDPRYSEPSDCYWRVYVRETVSGKETMVYVDITSIVTSVALSESFIEI